MKYFHNISLVFAAMIAVSCGVRVPLTLTSEECSLINDSPEVMRVLTVANAEDSLFLRQSCRNLNMADIHSDEFKVLSRKMVSTLVSPEQDGVGIAGPQVGLSRRIIAVQRFDKEGEPIEIYVNPWIVETRGELVPGPEGCLSVPNCRGDVPRWQDITICYTDTLSDRIDQPREIREDIVGYTAVIFQHEIDHLDGIIYTDKVQ